MVTKSEREKAKQSIKDFFKAHHANTEKPQSLFRRRA
jgi:hypothetical protein